MKPINFTIIETSKRIIFSFLLCLSFLGINTPLQAQLGGDQAVGVVSGVVVDSISGEALSYVSVALQHARFNKVLNGASTDEKGRFRLEGLAAGKYRLRISMIGYEEKTITAVEIKEDGVICNIGKVSLSSGHLLDEIEIVGERAVIEQHFDKLVYNVGADIGAGNQTLNDLLRKVPMVTVDATGEVSLRGNTNFQLLIDGKPSGVFASNTADALRAIPADQVERIEVITMPSARYDMEGAAGIINIITKHKRIEGYNASINVSGGNYMSILNTNLNARGKMFGARLQAGGTMISPQKMAMATTRIDKTARPKTELIQQGVAQFNRVAMNYLLGVDFDPSDFHSLSTTFKYNPTSSGMSNSTQVDFASELEHFFTTNQHSESDRDNQTLSWTTDYRKTFDNPDNKWDASFQWATYKRHSDYLVNEHIGNVMTMSEMADNNGTTIEMTAQTDYVHTFSDKVKIETGGKFIHRRINSGSDFLEFIPAEDRYIQADGRSFALLYEQQISAVYLESDIQLKEDWNLRIGGRMEHTHNVIQVEGNNNLHNYFNLSPTIAINHIKEAANFTLSYARRITRPSLSHLNPFENRQDPFSWHKGNPNLRPELVDAIDLNFSQPFKDGFIAGDVFYHYTQDIIEKTTSFQTNEQTLSSYLNIGDNHNWGVNAYFSYNFNDNWNLKGGTMANYYLLNDNVVLEGNINKGLSYNIFGMLAWKWKHGLTLETVYAYLGSRITAQGKTAPFTTYQATIRKDVLKKGAITLVLVNPFTPTVNFGNTLETPEIYQSTNVAVPLRMITLGFNYSFNKNMPMGSNNNKKSVDNDDQKQEEKSNY